MKLISLSVILGILIAIGSDYYGFHIDTLTHQTIDKLRSTISSPPGPLVDLSGKDNLQLCEKIPSYWKTIWSPDGREYTFVSVLEETCRWKVVSDYRNATLLWSTGHSDMPSNVKKSIRYGQGQIWSQLEDSWILCDKARLHRLLKSVGRLDLQPETFYLSDSSECVKFFQSADASPETIWITKQPTSSQGDGIVVNPNVNELKQEWLVNPDAKGEEYQCKKESEEIIAQRYITNPLLLEGKKMEIRTYWAIVSVDPLIVIYRDGTVRLTTRDYVHGDWNDPLIHITNTKQQKKADPNYEETAVQRKWNLKQLSSYLKATNKLDQDPDEWLNSLREKLKERIAICVKASHSQFLAKKTRPGWDGRFELMGMDVILDDQLQVWLTEIQDGPSLSLDPGIKQYVIPNLIRELVDVVMEVDLTLRSNRTLPFPLRSLGEWHQLNLSKYTI